MNMNEIITTEKAQKRVVNAMDEITRATKKVLMDYVLKMYHNSLAKAIVFLGIDSPEGKELLDSFDNQTRKIIESAAYGLQKSDETVTSEVEHILNS